MKPTLVHVVPVSDARVTDLLRQAREQGLQPRSDAELLPLLLKLLGGHVPVSQWPTQMDKKEKKARARQAAQGDQAASDRAGTSPETAAGQQAGDGPGNVVPLRWPEQAAQASDAIDAERRRRREAAVPRRPAPPQSLGDRLRATSMLSIPDEDDE